MTEERAKDTTTGSPPTGAPVVTLTSGDPKLSGDVKFRIPNLYEQIAIERRMTELANLGAGPGKAPLTFEALTAFGRYLVEAVATLEQVIVHAPEGFYADTPRGPELAVGRLSSTDQDVLLAAYQGYLAFRERFRSAREGDGDGDAEQPAGETHRDRGEPDGPGSAGSAGNPE